MKGLKILLTFVLLFASFKAFAQVDPSAVLLLRKSTNSSDDYSSSRYTVKPKAGAEVKKEEEKLKTIRKPQKFVENIDKSPKEKEVKPRQAPEAEKKKEVSLIEKAKAKSFSIDLNNLEHYRSVLHPKDKRRNIIEFSLGPSYFYQNSSSRYWPRSYYSTSPSLDASLAMWLSPFLGIKTSYHTSLNAQLKSSPSGLEFEEVDHSWFKAGLRFRKFFGISRKAKSLNFGLDFYEYQFEVPADVTQRMGLQSKGVNISLEADLPSSNTQSWYFGFEIMPNLSHRENKKSADIESGSKNSSSAMGLWFGKKLRFDRKNQIYWKINHLVEKKQLFRGVRSYRPFIGI